jgi:NADH:ubiquinone oxidoreductase subunit E
MTANTNTIDTKDVIIKQQKDRIAYLTIEIERHQKALLEVLDYVPNERLDYIPSDVAELISDALKWRLSDGV